jgi:hypothetical protein
MNCTSLSSGYRLVLRYILEQATPGFVSSAPSFQEDTSQLRAILMNLDRPLEDMGTPDTSTLMYFLDYYTEGEDDFFRSEFSESDELAIYQLEEACKNSGLLIFFAHFERTEVISRIPHKYPLYEKDYWNDDEESEYDEEESEYEEEGVYGVRLSRFTDSEGSGPFNGLEISLDQDDFNYIQDVHGLFEDKTPEDEVEEDGQRIKTFNRTVRIVSILTSQY